MAVFFQKNSCIFLLFVLFSLSCYSQESGTNTKSEKIKKEVGDKPVRNSNEVEVISIPTQKDVYVFKFTNTSKSTIDIGYYFRRTNGGWSDMRGINDVKPGMRVEGTGYFANGEILVFVRRAGSINKFPNRNEIKN